MRLFLLTALALVAFAANSVLTRMAVGPGHAGALDFSVIRLGAGAAMLALALLVRGAGQRQSPAAGRGGRVAGVAGLLLYLFGFSFAYLGLAAGTGALILFGFVQITMFAGALAAREPVPAARWAGAGIAFSGLVLLLVPGGAAASPPHAAAMAAAGVGWGIYSLAGRGGHDPLASTAANFGWSLPLALAAILPVALVYPDLGLTGIDTCGIVLAAVCGALSTGLGYALWYAVIPALGAARAGVAQLAVPLLAAAAGVVWLGEPIGLRFLAAAALVLGGVALAMAGRRR